MIPPPLRICPGGTGGGRDLRSRFYFFSETSPRLRPLEAGTLQRTNPDPPRPGAPGSGCGESVSPLRFRTPRWPRGLCGRGRPLSGPECPLGLPELEGEKLAMAPAPPLPGHGGPPARSGLLPCPGRGAAQGQGRFSPPGPAVLSGAPPPPRSPSGPAPTLPAGARAPSWSPNLAYLASRRRLGVWLSLWAPPLGSHLAPSRSQLLTPPPVSSPLPPGAANPYGLRASSPGRATGSS